MAAGLEFRPTKATWQINVEHLMVCQRSQIALYKDLSRLIL